MALFGVKMALLGTTMAFLGSKWHFQGSKWHFWVQKWHFQVQKWCKMALLGTKMALLGAKCLPKTENRLFRLFLGLFRLFYGRILVQIAILTFFFLRPRQGGTVVNEKKCQILDGKGGKFSGSQYARDSLYTIFSIFQPVGLGCFCGASGVRGASQCMPPQRGT